MSISNALASVAVRDLDASVRWYERLLERAVESRPMPGLAEWTFERGGCLQLYQEPERAGAGSVTLVVDDIDAHVERLEQLHMDTSQRTNSDKARTVIVRDPDGNRVALAQALDPSLAN